MRAYERYEKNLQLWPIAKAITAHLLRFEYDPRINVPVRNGPDGQRNGGSHRPYFHPSAYPAQPGIAIVYMSPNKDKVILSREDAVRYLAWLDAGNIGKHYLCPDIENKDRMIYGCAAYARAKFLKRKAAEAEVAS